MSAGRRTRWGWHRLADEWARRLVRNSQIAPGDLVLDVGAGTGAITAQLVAAGAHVVAVELHSGRATGLRRRFADDPVRVLQVDATDLWLPNRPFRVVANPPFRITTALLRRLLRPHSRLQGADLIVPAHTAARWAAGRGADARRWMPRFTAELGGPMPVRAFVPPPPQPAAVLRIRARPPERQGR